MKKTWILYCMLFAGAVAQGTVIFNLYEDGSDVVLSGSGTWDLTALVQKTGAAGGSGIFSVNAVFRTGPMDDIYDMDRYWGLSGQGSIGSGSLLMASSGSGDLFGVTGVYLELLVPKDYVSGTELSGEARFNSVSLADLGVTPGTYVWTWGSGQNADTAVLNIGVVPEPATAMMLFFGAGAGVLIHRLRRWANR